MRPKTVASNFGWVIPVAAIGIASAAPAQTQTRIYVDGSLQAAGDGESWSTALNSLHAAIGPAQSSGLPIWVKAGTYRPHASDRNVSFTITAPVVIFGGFAGTEEELEERDVGANPTYLDGDLGSNDQPDFVDRGDNSHHVVRIAVADDPQVWGQNAFVVLDGFIIRGGNADGGGIGPGGVARGGGVLLENAYLFYDAERRLVLRETTVEDCMAGNAGGGVSAEQTFIEIRDVRIVGNLVTGDVGVPDGGGGLFSGPLLATRCVIAGNRAVNSDGGGASISGFPDPEIGSRLVNVEVIGNRSGSSGGGLFLAGEFISLANCLLAKNHVEEDTFPLGSGVPGVGGGAYVRDKASFINCTVVDNTAVNDHLFHTLVGVGAGIGIKWSDFGTFASFEFKNGVAWGNEVTTLSGPVDHHAAQVMVLGLGDVGTSPLAHSNIQNYVPCLGFFCQGGGPDEWFNIGNVVAVHNPVFNDPSSNDYRHRSGAMASAGESLFVPDDENDLDDNGITNEALPLDLTLGPRFLGVAVDMGAHEWCVADLDLDGMVDGADLGALLNNWGQPGLGDLDGDGNVDGADLGILLNKWGPCVTENQSGGSMQMMGGGAFEALFGEYVDELLETWGFETWAEFLDWLGELEGWEVAMILEDLL